MFWFLKEFCVSGASCTSRCKADCREDSLQRFIWRWKEHVVERLETARRSVVRWWWSLRNIPLRIFKEPVDFMLFRFFWSDLLRDKIANCVNSFKLSGVQAWWSIFEAWTGVWTKTGANYLYLHVVERYCNVHISGRREKESGIVIFI